MSSSIGKSPAQWLRELRPIPMGAREILLKYSAVEFYRQVTKAADALERKEAGPNSREATDLIRRLRSLADVGIVNAKADTDTLRRAADWIEAADERIAIQEESVPDGRHVIRPGENVDLLAALDEGKNASGPIGEG